MINLFYYEFKNTLSSIFRNKMYSFVIIVVLIVAMLFPSASLMNAHYNYQEQKSSFYIGKNYFLLNQGEEQLSWASARSLNQELKEIEGVIGLGYGGNMAIQVFSKYSAEELPIRWANEELLGFEGVSKQKLEVLKKNTNKLYITQNTSERLFLGMNPQGQAIEILGKSFIVEEIYNENAVPFDTILDTNTSFGIESEYPRIDTAVIQFSSFSQSVYDEVLKVLRIYNLDTQLSSYEDFKDKEMAQAYKAYFLAIILCVLLWLFSLVNMISLLVYKFERDHLKWSLIFIFGGSKSSVYRQIYMELFLYTFCAYISMIPILYLIKYLMKKVDIPMEMTLSVVSIIIIIAILTTIIFGYVWIRNIDLRNLQREMKSQ